MKTPRVRVKPMYEYRIKRRRNGTPDAPIEYMVFPDTAVRRIRWTTERAQAVPVFAYPALLLTRLERMFGGEYTFSVATMQREQEQSAVERVLKMRAMHPYSEKALDDPQSAIGSIAALDEEQRENITPALRVIAAGMGWVPMRCHARRCSNLVDPLHPWVRYHATVFESPDGRITDIYHEHTWGLLYCSEACMRDQFEHGSKPKPSRHTKLHDDGTQEHEYLRPQM